VRLRQLAKSHDVDAAFSAGAAASWFLLENIAGYALNSPGTCHFMILLDVQK
jgi:hypothetical protein